jgi:hypothetical protein
LIEFHYFGMVLAGGISPAVAVRQAHKLIGYAGDDGSSDSPYPPAGFRVFMPNK